MRLLQRNLHIAANIGATAVMLEILNLFLPGLKLQSWSTTIIAVVVIGLLNAFILPVVVWYTLPLTILSLGSLSLFFNAVIVMAASVLIPGFFVENIWTAFIISFSLTVTHVLVMKAYLSDDQQNDYEYQRIQRLTKIKGLEKNTTSSGLIILEIDGLAEPFLRLAISQGYLPTLKKWLDNGQFTLRKWETSLPAETSAMQAGILYGSHFNISGFHYYDKKNKRYMFSNNPVDAATMIQPLTNGGGLLKNDGFAVNNWADGGAPNEILTFTSALRDDKNILNSSGELWSFFSDAHAFQQALLEMVVEIFTEWKEELMQILRNVQPRARRGFEFVFTRAILIGLFQQISCYLMVEKIIQGISIAYTTFSGYDMMAHYTSPTSSEALKVLRKIDYCIAKIARAAENSHHGYDFVLLSDHGQSSGVPFPQKYGTTLGELVESILQRQHMVEKTRDDLRMAAQTNLLLTMLIQGRRIRSRIIRRMLRKRIKEGFVDIRKSRKQNSHSSASTIICSSGNLAHIYFNEWEERLSLEKLMTLFPGLVEQLVHHPGIEFALIFSEKMGPVVIGKEGLYILQSKEVKEKNPLEIFSKHAPRHLHDLALYPTAGDIILNGALSLKRHLILNTTRVFMAGWVDLRTKRL